MSEFKDRIKHFYCQTDHTIKFPNSCEGDLLKIALSEIKELEAQLVYKEKVIHLYELKFEELEAQLATISEQIVSDRWNCKRENPIGKIVHEMLDNYEAILDKKLLTDDEMEWLNNEGKGQPMEKQDG